METNSVNALRLTAALGQGLIWMPDFLVRNAIKSGKLVPVLTEFSCLGLAINAVYPHRQHLATNVRSFLDLVTKYFHGAGPDVMREEVDVPALPAVIAGNGPAAPLRLNA